MKHGGGADVIHVVGPGSHVNLLRSKLNWWCEGSVATGLEVGNAEQNTLLVMLLWCVIIM